MSRRRRSILLFGVLALTVALWFVVPSLARTQQATKTTASHAAVATLHIHHGRVTNAERKAAAARAAALGLMPGGTAQGRAVARATGVPDYFGTIPNYANSPPPAGPIGLIRVTNGGSGYGASVTVQISDIVWGSGTGAKAKATVVNGRVTAITVTAGGSNYVDPKVTIVGKGHGAAALASLNGAKLKGGIRKFVDALPGLGAAGKNGLGQYIPVAVADTTTFPGSDYYEIALVQYKEKLSRDLPATTLRGYVQVETAANANASKHIALTYPDGSPIRDATGSQVYALDNPQYLGPTIVAQSNRPVRVKFTNYLPAGAAGNLFLPVDTTLMGAGLGPNGARRRRLHAESRHASPARRRHPVDQRRHAVPVDRPRERDLRPTSAASACSSCPTCGSTPSPTRSSPPAQLGPPTIRAPAR